MNTFDINQYIKSISLDTINLISLTYYSSKSEIMNIYDTNFSFNENIVPLVTSVLETKPNIVNAKRYCNVNSESIIIIADKDDIPNKSEISYPCFFSDIQKNKLNMKNVQGYTKKLINTLDIDINNDQDQDNSDKYNCEDEDNVEDEDNCEEDVEDYNLKYNIDSKAKSSLLMRMYKLENKKGEYGHSILNEDELTIIVWSWEYANFQIIINKKNPQICQLHLNIYITEDNKIIMTKLQHINNLIIKIHKIKNEMVSRAM